jgi:hypothetical protein
MAISVRFDPDHPISYGYFSCPVCHAEFYGGGKAMHEQECTEKGYEGCVYVFGPSESLDFAPLSQKDAIRKILARVV